MRKPAALTRLLTVAVPEIAAAPDKLQLFVTSGGIEARRGATLGFTYRYELMVTVTDYAGDFDDLVTPVMAWIAEAQPDLLARADGRPFRFEAELLDAATYDVSLFLDLSEDVAVAVRPGGGWSATHLDEARAIADDDFFPGACDARLWQLLLRDPAGVDEEAARTSDPAFTG